MARMLLPTHGTNGDSWPPPWTTDFIVANGTTQIQGNRLRLLTANSAGAQQRAIHGAVFPNDFDILTCILPGSNWSVNGGVPILCVGDTWGPTGTDLPNNGWGFWLQGTSGRVRIYRRINDTGSFIADAAFTYPAATTQIWIRCHKQGVFIAMKAWLATSREPEAWTISANDTSGTTTGPWKLMLVNTGTVNFNFHYDQWVLDDLQPIKPRVNFRRS